MKQTVQSAYRRRSWREMVSLIFGTFVLVIIACCCM